MRNRTASRLCRPLALFLLVVACSPAGGQTGTAGVKPASPAIGGSPNAIATFAMGCFWCAEDAFEGKPGVISVTSGYTGGREENPSYEEVSAHQTGHFEAIEITFDPTKVTYDQLLEIFWHNVDPGDGNGQFCDKGEQYRSAIFFQGEGQRRVAEASKERVAKKLGRVETLILPASAFYPAEDYHQGYAKKNPLRYRFYSTGCGRAARLHQVWGAEAGGQH